MYLIIYVEFITFGDSHLTYGIWQDGLLKDEGSAENSTFQMWTILRIPLTALLGTQTN